MPHLLLVLLAGIALGIGGFELTLYARGARILFGCVEVGAGLDPRTFEVFRASECEGGPVVMDPTGLLDVPPRPFGARPAPEGGATL